MIAISLAAVVLTMLSIVSPAFGAPITSQVTTGTTASFNRFFVIILENQDYGFTLQEPYFGKTLLERGRLLSNYFAVTHPSQPNYAAMVSGSTDQVYYDFDATITRPSIADLFDKAGVTWGVYAEDYPGNCYTGSWANNYLYSRKHVPFISFPSITNNATRCANIRNSNDLKPDIESDRVPEYVMYVPNMNNDAHDTDLPYASNWLQSFLEPILDNPYFADTLFLITFDESAAPFYMWWYDPNQVYAVLIGKGVTPGSVDDTKYDHYSQLATIEKRWGLGNLGLADVNATAFDLS